MRGYGRDKRSVELDELYCLRVLSDATMLEVFVNDGEVALTSRTYSSRRRRCSCAPRATPRWSFTVWLASRIVSDHGVLVTQAFLGGYRFIAY